MLSWFGRFLSTSIGKKTLMALTGLALVGFLIAHLLGNLTLYTGNEAFNAYAQKLEDLGPLLWVAEIGLLVLFAVHIGLALKTSRENKDAREHRYQVRASHGQRSFASSSMLITGLIVGVFLVIHIIDFRIAKMMGSKSVEDLAMAVRARLGSPIGAFLYLAGIVALGVHLRHAISSALQTLGANHPKYNDLIRVTGIGLSVAIAAGFASFPIYLLVTA